MVNILWQCMIVIYYKLLLMLKGKISKTLDYYFLIVTKMGFRLRLNAGQARSWYVYPLSFRKPSIVSALTVNTNSRARGRVAPRAGAVWILVIYSARIFCRSCRMTTLLTCLAFGWRRGACRSKWQWPPQSPTPPATFWWNWLGIIGGSQNLRQVALNKFG